MTSTFRGAVSRFRKTTASRPLWTLLLGLTLLSVLPMALFSGWVVNRILENQRRGRITELIQRTESVSSAVEQLLRGGALALTALTGSRALNDGDLAVFHEEAERFLSRQSLAATVAIVDADGRIMVNSAVPFGTPLPHTVETASAVEALEKRGPVISNLYRSAVSATDVIAINLPLTDGAFAGSVLRLVLETAPLSRVLASQGLPNGWIAAVVDRDRRIVARSRVPERYVGRSASREAIAFLAANSTGIIQARSLEGVPLTTSFRPLGDLGMTVAVGVPTAVLDEPLRRSRIAISAGALLACLLAIAAALILARRLGRRVAHVTEAAAAMGTPGTQPDGATGIRELDAIIAAQAAAKRLIAQREAELEDSNRRLKAAKDEAERANRAKSRFLAAVSHDLRQPAQGLFLFHGGLRQRLADASGPVDELLRGAEHSARAMKSILDAMLDVSRIDSGMVEVRPEAVPLGELLNRLGAEFRLAAAEKGLSLRVVDTSLGVWTDPVLLGQILRNFISNALRYTDEGGVVIGCRRRAGLLSVQVVDSGVGIPNDAVPDIFEEYVQLGNPERDREKGLGLGLSIVSRLAALLKAPVTVRSGVGRGSLFAVDLPIVALPAAHPTPPVAAANDDRLGTIILIDDEPLVLKSLGLLLESWGYDIIAAGTVDEAVDRAQRIGHCRHTLIIADYRLQGGQTGTDAIRRIREVCRIDAPSIVLTGDTAPERLREALASGFTILNKPIEPQQLRAVVARALERGGAV